MVKSNESAMNTKYPKTVVNSGSRTYEDHRDDCKHKHKCVLQTGCLGLFSGGFEFIKTCLLLLKVEQMIELS